MKTYFSGIETQRSQFEEFDGGEIAHQIKVMRNGAVEILISVTQVSPAGTIPADAFDLPGHEWNRAFTDEVR